MTTPAQSVLSFSLPVQEHEPFDVCAVKHGGAETSVEANLVCDKEGQRRMIRQILRTNKTACVHRIKELTGWDANQFSGRLTYLREDLLIEEVGICDGHGKRGRAAIYRLTSLGKELAEREAQI